MRTVTYGAACSLDGFIADANGAVDWLHYSEDVTDVMAKYWSTVDAILMGRKTWDVAAAAQGESVDAGAFGEMKSYVFSRTLREIDRPGVTLVSEDPGAFVRRLKGQPGKGICLLGGGELAGSLFEADVIDEVGVNVHPILLGAGVPLFRDPGRRIALELIESRTIAGGCVLATYRVVH
ncbi:MAG TPA: dihydrofolate reductase family protein [Gemmatimonadaceae bacterium]|nr:dihydrofolate reductase family protein [Gemmatimonadaceae bacterium]